MKACIAVPWQINPFLRHMGRLALCKGEGEGEGSGWAIDV
jgi:hypothetical protein